MGRHDRESRRDRGEKEDRKKKRKGKKGELQAQLELVTSVVEEVRTIDSEIDLMKQKMNLIIRELNVLKRVVLTEKKEIKELQLATEQEKSRFESILSIVKGLKGGGEETV